MFLQVNQLEKAYGATKVLKGISFDLDRSENLAIVGSSGSGKSSLLYTLGTLEKVTSGQIKIDGKDITRFKDEELANFRNKSIGFVFQFHFLLPSMSALDNILLPAKIGGFSTKEIKKRIDPFVELLKVGHCLKKYPYQLSGGEQQRINIIRALSLNPALLLCDEPTGNLDSKNTDIVLELLHGILKEIDSTLILVTHDEKVANSFDRKITIEDGQIIS